MKNKFFKSLFIFMLVVLIIPLLFGCTDTRDTSDQKAAQAAADDAQTAVSDSGTTENGEKNYLSVDEILQDLNSGKEVYARDIAPVPERPVIGIWNGGEVNKPYTSAKEIFMEQMSLITDALQRDSNISLSSVTVGVKSTYVYKIELEDGKYYALAEYTGPNPSDVNLLLNTKDSEEIPDDPFPSPENNRVVAVIEDRVKETEADNHRASAETAVSGRVSVKEAAEILNNGGSVMLSDLILPEGDVFAVSALLADRESGIFWETENKTKLFLEEGTAEQYKKALEDGSEMSDAALALELISVREEDGFTKKLTLYAYLPVELLDEAVKLNTDAEPDETGFYEKHKAEAVIYKITESKSSKVLYADPRFT